MASKSVAGGAPGPRMKSFSRPNLSRPRPRPQPRPTQKKPVKKAKDVTVVVRSEFPETWIWTEDKIEYVALRILIIMIGQMTEVVVLMQQSAVFFIRKIQ